MARQFPTQAAARHRRASMRQDEIQEVPRAITALKYFCENMRELYVACAGSLLGVALRNENISFPVGKVNRMQMFPMSFREFVVANGGEKYLELLSGWNIDREIPEMYARPLEQLLREYYIVGGDARSGAGVCQYSRLQDCSGNTR